MAKAASGGMLEVELGKLVAARAATPKAKKVAQQMVTDHQKSANTMMAHEKMAQDADLKAFISKTLPIVQQHLSMAQKSSDMKM